MWEGDPPICANDPLITPNNGEIAGTDTCKPYDTLALVLAGRQLALPDAGLVDCLATIKAASLK
ncbi:MAG: hypothetical protein ACM3PY_03415 [Omnitrophica WOR_2 bacterium]